MRERIIFFFFIQNTGEHYAEDYRNQSIPSSAPSAPDSLNDRRSFIWLWIILGLIALVAVYSTYNSRQTINGANVTNASRSDAAVNPSTGQTAPNTQAPNTETPNTQR